MTEPSDWAKQEARRIVSTVWSDKQEAAIAVALDEALRMLPPGDTITFSPAGAEYRRGFLDCRERAAEAVRHIESRADFPGENHKDRATLAREAIEQLEPEEP